MRIVCEAGDEDWDWVCQCRQCLQPLISRTVVIKISRSACLLHGTRTRMRDDVESEVRVMRDGWSDDVVTGSSSQGSACDTRPADLDDERDRCRLLRALSHVARPSDNFSFTRLFIRHAVTSIDSLHPL